MFPFLLHTSSLKTDEVPMISGLSIRQWMSVMSLTDYVISVDTSSFHLAGGLGKPVLGIFSIVSGETYSKYYPQAITLQGNCPLDHSGCYLWNKCPVTREIRKPCITSIKVNEIIEKFKKLISKFPC